MEKGQQLQKQKGDKQKSLFSETENGSSFSYNGKYPEIPEWPESELLAYEKEALGFFISSHPLVSFEKELKKVSNTDTKEIQNLKDGAEAKIGGVPVALNEIKTKRGDMMGFVTLEDLKGSIEVIVFAELYKKISPIIKSEQPILVKGKVTLDATNLKTKVKAEEVTLLADAVKILPSSVHVHLDISVLSKPHLEKLKNILKNHPGQCTTYLHLVIPGQSETVISLPDEFHLNPSEGLSKEVEYLFGSQVMTFD
jgi:DNA polymerase-3 subunit alpha